MRIRKILLILGLFLLALIVERVLLGGDIFNQAELLTYDLRASLATDRGPYGNMFKPRDKDIVILAVDDYSGRVIANNPQLNLGSWPWRRDVWSPVADFIEKGNPKALLFDLTFINYSDKSQSDINLANTLKKYDNIVLATGLNDPREFLVPQAVKIYGQNFSEAELTKDVVNSKYLPAPKSLDVFVKDKGVDNLLTYYSHIAIPEIYTKHNMMGVVNKVSDYDSVIRRSATVYKLVKNNETYYLPSLAFAGFLKYVGEDGKIIIKNNKLIYKDRVIPINSHGQFNVSWHGNGHNYEYIHISDVLLSLKNNKKISPNYFKDKIVIVGRTQIGTDIHPSSVNKIYTGPEFNATAIDNLINDSNPKESTRKFVMMIPTLVQYLITILCCLLVIALGISSENAFLAFLNSFIFMFLYVIFAIFFFVYPHLRLWFFLIYPLYYMMVTAGIVFAFKLQKEMSNRESITNMFGKFVSPKVLSSLLKNQDNLVLTANKKRITVMFCDVKDFTSLSEKCNPEQLVHDLNELFEIIVNIIFENNGTVDKFIGDCIMAYWGDPIASEDDAYMAVKTALEIKKRVNDLRVMSEREGKISFDVKMGINTGDALLGLSGSNQLMSYTAMGDAVNTASRLESACSKLEKDVLISKTTYDALEGKIKAKYVDKIKLKGKDEQIEVFEPIVGD